MKPIAEDVQDLQNAVAALVNQKMQLIKNCEQVSVMAGNLGARVIQEQPEMAEQIMPALDAMNVAVRKITGGIH